MADKRNADENLSGGETSKRRAGAITRSKSLSEAKTSSAQMQPKPIESTAMKTGSPSKYVDAIDQPHQSDDESEKTMVNINQSADIRIVQSTLYEVPTISDMSVLGLYRDPAKRIDGAEKSSQQQPLRIEQQPPLVQVVTTSQQTLNVIEQQPPLVQGVTAIYIIL